MKTINLVIIIPCWSVLKKPKELDSQFNISSYVHVRNGKIWLNGKLLFQNETEELTPFIKSAYKNLNISYPKFFKMDTLSKLAFVATEVLLQESVKDEENIAVLLSNNASSLDTDRTYQESISDPKNYFPSPSVFVYTLPNICIGEICIRHQLFSENSFFIFDAFNPTHLWIHAENLLKTEKALKVLCGWVDVDDSSYDAFLYMVETTGDIHHNIEQIKRLYVCQ